MAACCSNERAFCADALSLAAGAAGGAFSLAAAGAASALSLADGPAAPVCLEKGSGMELGILNTGDVPVDTRLAGGSFAGLSAGAASEVAAKGSGTELPFSKGSTGWLEGFTPGAVLWRDGLL